MPPSTHGTASHPFGAKGALICRAQARFGPCNEKVRGCSTPLARAVEADGLWVSEAMFAECAMSCPRWC